MLANFHLHGRLEGQFDAALGCIIVTLRFFPATGLAEYNWPITMNLRDRKLPLLLRWLPLALVLLALPTQATVIVPRNLYEGEVRVDAKTTATREALMRQALGQVLVRITGDRDIAQRKTGIELMKMAARLVQQFDYDRRPAPPVKGVLPSVPVEEIKVFRARFDARVLDAQLRERGLPVWGRERPVTQLVLGVQEDDSRWLLTEGIAAVEAPSVLQAALGRGVPVALPATAAANEIQDVMQGSTAGLAATAKAAGHQRLLIGRVTQKGQQWNGSWMLLDNGQVQDRWQGTAANREEALAFGIDQLANAYAARYAVRGGAVSGTGAVRLEVQGIEDAKDYARVLKYLTGLSTVTNVDVVEMADGRGYFELRMRGDHLNLQQSIALSDVLRLAPAAVESIDRPMSYQLVK